MSLERSLLSAQGYIELDMVDEALRGRTMEAKELLVGGPSTLQHEPTYHYNLGCYHAVLGNLDEAARHLETSFEMDKKFREIAKYDPDLKAVQDLLGK